MKNCYYSVHVTSMVKRINSSSRVSACICDSNPEYEYQETMNKAGALMAAAKDSYKYN